MDLYLIRAVKEITSELIANPEYIASKAKSLNIPVHPELEQKQQKQEQIMINHDLTSLLLLPLPAVPLPTKSKLVS